MSIRVICLGPYSGDILTVAGNIRRGMDLATEAALAGFYVWPCWADWDMATRANLPMEWFKANTIAWMRVAEAILLAPGWEHSNGVQAELAIASELGIPTFETVEELIVWRDESDALQRIEPVPLTEDEKGRVIAALGGKTFN